MPIPVDAEDQVGHGLVAARSDLSQALPERIFQADAGLVTIN